MFGGWVDGVAGEVGVDMMNWDGRRGLGKRRVCVRKEDKYGRH